MVLSQDQGSLCIFPLTSSSKLLQVTNFSREGTCIHVWYPSCWGCQPRDMPRSSGFDSKQDLTFMRIHIWLLRHTNRPLSGKDKGGHFLPTASVLSPGGIAVVSFRKPFKNSFFAIVLLVLLDINLIGFQLVVLSLSGSLKTRGTKFGVQIFPEAGAATPWEISLRKESPGWTTSSFNIAFSFWAL